MSSLLRRAQAVGINMLVVLVCAVPPESATAQGVSLGFKGGLNRSTNTSKLNPNLGKARTGFHVGTTFSIQSPGPFALQVGASYTKKGADLETGVPGVTGGFELWYVEVPALAVMVFAIGPTSKVAPFVLAGPAIGIEVGCDVKGENQGVPVSGSCTDAGAATKSVDMGMMLGGGLRFAAGQASVVLDAAYTLGIVNIDDTSPSTDDVKNRNLSFSVGLMFPIGGQRPRDELTFRESCGLSARMIFELGLC